MIVGGGRAGIMGCTYIQPQDILHKHDIPSSAAPELGHQCGREICLCVDEHQSYLEQGEVQ
jgi:hypothetical protein